MSMNWKRQLQYLWLLKGNCGKILGGKGLNMLNITKASELENFKIVLLSVTQAINHSSTIKIIEKACANLLKFVINLLNL